jgi:hypothetical protein
MKFNINENAQCFKQDKEKDKKERDKAQLSFKLTVAVVDHHHVRRRNTSTNASI